MPFAVERHVGPNVVARFLLLRRWPVLRPTREGDDVIAAAGTGSAFTNEADGIESHAFPFVRREVKAAVLNGSEYAVEANGVSLQDIGRGFRISAMNLDQLLRRLANGQRTPRVVFRAVGHLS